MPALETAATAPNISLKTTDGKAFSLDDALRTTPVVAAFFKGSCPVCQYAFPFFERVSRAYAKDKVTFIGVSQDELSETNAFTKQFGVTFPIVLDDVKKYPASNAYGLTNVPSIFYIAPDGKIELSSVGWSKQDIEQLNQLVAKAAGVPPAQIFKPGEQVHEFKAG